MGSIKISSTGYWYRAKGKHLYDYSHSHDKSLCKAIEIFLKAEQAQSICDFGCGNGDYVLHLLTSGLNAIGYDGSPDLFVPGIIYTLDLSHSFKLDQTFD